MKLLISTAFRFHSEKDAKKLQCIFVEYNVYIIECMLYIDYRFFWGAYEFNLRESAQSAAKKLPTQTHPHPVTIAPKSEGATP